MVSGQRSHFYWQRLNVFFAFSTHPEPNPTTRFGDGFDFGTDNAYQFFLDLGPLKNANEKYFDGNIAFWDSLMKNGINDRFWQSRNIIPQMKNVTASVMTVAGLFDAEDPHGPMSIYHSIEANNPGINNSLVLGPWFHGGWVRGLGDHLGNVSFEQEASTYYQENVDLPFFNSYLKGKEGLDLPEVLAFATGSNEWHELANWPPVNTEPTTLYLQADGALGFSIPEGNSGSDSYVSDPANPVPYTKQIRIN